MVRHGPYKYVYHARMDEVHGPERELYNLDEDPGEFENLAGDPEYQSVVEKMHGMLLDELGEDPDATEERCRADYAQGYDRDLDR